MPQSKRDLASLGLHYRERIAEEAKRLRNNTKPSARLSRKKLKGKSRKNKKTVRLDKQNTSENYVASVNSFCHFLSTSFCCSSCNNPDNSLLVSAKQSTGAEKKAEVAAFVELIQHEIGIIRNEQAA